ncbi:hypothetical protein JV46_12490 [Solemya velum gill symbiont]|uniref:Uncharacterized protein n=1 Tax=Solemya velum gill symbiont TaxID=2340 RepID=A0A0B0H940_SOVGS|nr:hypothetical protein JV46_12490 [Solemya velum gill symbiont]
MLVLKINWFKSIVRVLSETDSMANEVLSTPKDILTADIHNV